MCECKVCMCNEKKRKKEKRSKTVHACIRVKKSMFTKCLATVFCGQLKYRVNLGGAPREKVAQKPSASLLILNPVAYILLRHSIIHFRTYVTHMLRGVDAQCMELKTQPSNLVKTHLQVKPKYTLLSEIIYDSSRYMVIAMFCYWRNTAAAKGKGEAMFSNSISCNRCAEQSIYYKQIKPYEGGPIGFKSQDSSGRNVLQIGFL